MTQLDPEIILKAFAAPQLDVAGLLEKRDQLQQRGIQRQHEELAYKQQQTTYQQQQDALAKEQSAMARRQQAGQQYATGDVTGAHKTALSGGDFDLVKQLDTMDDSARSRAFDISQHTAPLLMSLKKVPPEARAQALQQIAPQLQQAGFTPDHIAQVGQDLSDGALDRIGTSAMTIAEYQKANESFTLGQDQQRFDGSGHLIAAGPESIKAITTPEGGTTTILGGAGHTGMAGGPAPAGGSPGHFTGHVGPQIESTVTSFVPGVTVTSRQRSAGHNASVGGVGNSFHLTDNARDFVPPPGMSMGQLASAIRGKLPGYDVLNEGNHIHVEPGPGMTRQSSGPMVIHGKPKAEPADAPTPLTADGLEFVAQQVAHNGPMPPLGMGRQAATMRAQIISRAAQIVKQENISPQDFLANGADRKANSAALTTLQKSAHQIIAYERTANYNADQVLATMGRGAAKSGMPIFNAWIQSGRRSVTGDPDVTKFDVAVNTFATEYARVVSGATGGAVTSDSARREAMAMINGKQTPQQLSSAITQMRADMANRKRGLTEQADTLRQALHSSPGSQTGNNIPTFSPDQARNAPKGTRFRTTDGRVMVRQ